MSKVFLLVLLSAVLASGCDSDSLSCQSVEKAAERYETASVSATNARINTFIRIEASPAQVWDTLKDFGTYSSWSTGFLGIEGAFEEGATVTARFRVNEQTVSVPHTLILKDGVSFGWSDPLITAPGVSDHHLYTVEPADCGGTLFIQSDQFQGNDPSIADNLSFAQSLRDFYMTFNRELKAEVERRF